MEYGEGVGERGGEQGGGGGGGCLEEVWGEVREVLWGDWGWDED